MAVVLQEDWSGYPENTQLQNITGWTISAPFANDLDKTQVNATSQLKNIGTNEVLCFYDSGVMDSYMKLTVAVWPNFLSVAVRCTDRENYIGARKFGNDVQVYHKTGSSAYNQIAMIIGANVIVGDVIELRLDDTNDLLKFLKNDVQLGSDMDVTGIQSGNAVGMYITVGDPIAGSVEIGGEAIADSITIDQLEDRKVYPGITPTVSHTISGQYVSSTLTAIEYRVEDFLTNATVIDWSVLDSSPSGDMFSEVVQLPIGKYYRIIVRLDDNQVITDSSTRIGVGEVIAVEGQSNANFLFTTTTTTIANDNVCIFDGVDTFSLPTNEAIIDAINEISTSLDRVVCVYNTAVNGTKITQHLPGGSNYQNRVDQLSAIGGKLTAQLWSQGESDISTPDMEQYFTNLGLLRSDLLTQASQPASELPMFIVQIGRTPGGTGAIGDLGWNTIRESQTSFSLISENVHISHQTMDLSMADTLHRDSAGRLQECLRFAGTLSSYNGQGFDGLGMIPLSVSLSSNEVNIQHDSNNSSSITLPSSAEDGYIVSEDGFSTTIPVNSISTSGSMITLTLSSTPSGDVEVLSQRGQDPDPSKMPTSSKSFSGQNVMVNPIILPISSSGSSLVMTGTNTPDGSYSADIYNDDATAFIETRSITFLNGNATEVLPVGVGTNVLVFIKGSNPPITGLAYIGVTV